MTRYRLELATPADDADLRHILAATPMPGAVSVGFHREPSYFAAAVVDGRERQVVAARDEDTGRLVGFGSRSVGQAYVNGRPAPVGYLSSLRLLRDHRNRHLLARGYALFRDLHRDGRAQLYLTTIAEDNAAALRLLTAGRAGLPTYHVAGQYHTAALPLGRRRPSLRDRGVTVRPARPDDLPAALAFWQAAGPRRQFFPCYEAADFFRPGGRFRGLRPEDLLLAFRSGELVGTLAGWDQTAFRQTVVHSYAAPLRWARPLVNGWNWLRGRPRLPAPGQTVRGLTAALSVVAGDDPACFASLLDAVLERSAAGPWDYLMLALHEADPLLPVVRSYPARRYMTRVYLVGWADGEPLRQSLDGRPLYLELGSL